MTDLTLVLPFVLVAIAEPGVTRPWTVNAFETAADCQIAAAERIEAVRADNPDAIAWCAGPIAGSQVVKARGPILAPVVSPRPKARP
jgi:hypothetical protein